ncbi:MAG: FAD:protein FMN transferase [Mucilaginibacter sp.]
MLAVKSYNNDLHIFRRTMRLMGNLFEISVVGNNPVWADSCIDGAIAEINRVEKQLSAITDGSLIQEINRNAGLKPVKVNAEIYRLIERSIKISELTQGAFDITYNAAENGQSAQNPANYKNVVLDEAANTIFLNEKSMRIGFGAISKGYAADRAKYILQMAGVASGVINAGGDLLTWGLQPDNNPWTIATADPRQQGQPYAKMNISNMAVATSGNFEKNANINDKTQVSDIDAKKGFPVSELKSVSVVSPTAELSDAMATPIMLMGVNAGLYLINKLQQLACVIIDDHDRIYTSKEINYLV